MLRLRLAAFGATTRIPRQDFEDEEHGGREADAAHETEDVERLTDVEDTLNYHFEVCYAALLVFTARR